MLFTDFITTSTGLGLATAIKDAIEAAPTETDCPENIESGSDIINSRDIEKFWDEIDSAFDLINQELAEFNDEWENSFSDEDEGEDAFPGALSLDEYLEELGNRDLAKHLDEAREERVLWTSVREQGKGYGDWDHGETLIREDHFKEYAQQFADDIGATNRDAKWPNNHIDWDSAANELRTDYTEVEIDGVTFLMRA